MKEFPLHVFDSSQIAGIHAPHRTLIIPEQAANLYARAEWIWKWTRAIKNRLGDKGCPSNAPVYVRVEKAEDALFTLLMGAVSSHESVRGRDMVAQKIAGHVEELVDVLANLTLRSGILVIQSHPL